MKRLLRRKVATRLGAGGAAEVRAHSWFEATEWDALARCRQSCRDVFAARPSAPASRPPRPFSGVSRKRELCSGLGVEDSGGQGLGGDGIRSALGRNTPESEADTVEAIDNQSLHELLEAKKDVAMALAQGLAGLLCVSRRGRLPPAPREPAVARDFGSGEGAFGVASAAGGGAEEGGAGVRLAAHQIECLRCREESVADELASHEAAYCSKAAGEDCSEWQQPETQDCSGSQGHMVLPPHPLGRNASATLALGLATDIDTDIICMV